MLGFQKLLCYVTLCLAGWRRTCTTSASFAPCCACPAPPDRQIPDPAPSRSLYQIDCQIVVPLMLPDSSLPSFCNRFLYFLVLTWLLHIIRSSGVSVLPLFCSAYPGPNFPMVPPHRWLFE
ncbi:hypothetical protein EV424DRAFT_1378177 [Suillus variegatus]|nr:hypothetical protein EV424DRAFT_1378177 [Suillus variegatus]